PEAARASEGKRRGSVSASSAARCAIKDSPVATWRRSLARQRASSAAARLAGGRASVGKMLRSVSAPSTTRDRTNHDPRLLNALQSEETRYGDKAHDTSQHVWQEAVCSQGRERQIQRHSN